MASSPRSPPPSTAPEFEISRQSRIFVALSKKVINLDEVRMLAAQGVPDGAGIWSTVWKLLLGFLPNDRSLWEQELAEKRSQYAAFKDEFLVSPYSEIMEQIDRDVKRTHPDMHFFCGDSSAAKSNQESLKNVLLIFAKLNAGIRYVQGMNEILAPLLVAFRSDPDDKNAGRYSLKRIHLVAPLSSLVGSETTSARN